MPDKKAVTIAANGDSRNGANYFGEIWTVNNGYKLLGAEKIDRAFMLHDLSYHTGHDLGGDYRDFKNTKARIISNKGYRRKGMEKYPFNEIKRHFSLENYYTSTIDYMLAMAIMEEFEVINLVGVDFHPLDIAHNRAKESATFWVGVAVGRRIEVYNTDRSFLCKTPIEHSGNYGEPELLSKDPSSDLPILGIKTEASFQVSEA